jgi:uncharacterized protein (TIGR02001 family)
MKILLLTMLLTIFAIPSVKADTLSSTAYFSSNYIYRGLSFSNQGNEYSSAGSPVLQASIDYLSDSGLGYSLFTGNVDSLNTDTFAMEKDQEVDSFLSYTKTLNETITGSLSINYYSLMRNSSASTLEYSGYISMGTLRFDTSYSPKYSGVDLALWYSKLSKRLYVSETSYFLAHIGSVVYSDNQLVQSSNYQDYRLGVGFTIEGIATEIAYTNTMNRRLFATDTVSTKDAAVTITVSKTFDLLPPTKK